MSVKEQEARLLSCLGTLVGSHHIANDNELHIQVKPESIRQVCGILTQDPGYRLAALFANDERGMASPGFGIYYILAQRESDCFAVVKTLIPQEQETFISIADRIFAASAYEREIQDLFGLKPEGHPDPKPLVFHGNWPQGHYPLRRDYDGSQKPAFAVRNQEFLRVKGEGVFEIPVGPVHAGIIEPGHFRFSVAGEPVINLEAQLYFVHKGIEKMCQGMDLDRCFYVSERISGDETFSNSLAFCQAVERIAGIQIPEQAALGRVLFAELERLTSHLGDLAGICLDAAYGFAAFQFRMLRGWAYQLADELCGMRFLRNVNRPGGLRKDFIRGKETKVLEALDRIQKELVETGDIIKANGMFIDRVEHTGVLKQEIALDLNATGPGGRSAGVHYDVRRAFPYAAYAQLEFQIPEHHNGDVNCRMNVKLEECLESINLMKQVAACTRQGPVWEEIGALPAYSSALGYTEAPRGENLHWLMTGEGNTVFRYKVRTPSFCNWPALCHAVRGNVVPDFPLINKSFNLSYAGNDL